MHSNLHAKGPNIKFSDKGKTCALSKFNDFDSGDFLQLAFSEFIMKSMFAAFIEQMCTVYAYTVKSFLRYFVFHGCHV